MPKKSQSAMEFVILTSLMILVFLIFYIVIQQKIVIATEDKNDAAAQQVMNLVINEIKLAESVTDDYSRQFSTPSYLNNLQYNITIIPGVGNSTELVIKYHDKEMVYFLEQYIQNNSAIHIGLNTITKTNGTIAINPS